MIDASGNTTTLSRNVGERVYSKFFQKVKDLVTGGEIGEPQLVWCKEFRGPFLKKVDDWIQDARFSGGQRTLGLRSWTTWYGSVSGFGWPKRAFTA